MKTEGQTGVEVVEFPLLASLGQSRKYQSSGSQGPKAKKIKKVECTPLPRNPIGAPDLGALTRSPSLSAYGKRKLENSEDEEEFNRVKCWYSKWNGQTFVTIKKQKGYTRLNMEDVPGLIVQLAKLYNYNPGFSTDYLKNALDYAWKLTNPRYVEIVEGGPLQEAGKWIPKVVIDGKVHARIDFELPEDLAAELKKDRGEPKVFPYIEN